MNWFSGITAFDILALLIFLAFVVRGVWIGFIRQISSLVAMIGGFALAGYFDNEFYHLILPFIDNSQTAFVVTYLLLFVASFYLIKLVGLGLKNVMDVTLTVWFDRTTGGILGFIKGLFLTTLLFIFISSFISGSNNYLKKSVSYPFFSYSSEVILAFVQDYDIRSYFKPKEPAIKLPFTKKSAMRGAESVGNFVPDLVKDFGEKPSPATPRKTLL